MIRKPIFIFGAHKSGTTLLRSLFDNHPDLFVIPIETHAFKHNGCGIDYFFKSQNPKSLTELEIKENYKKWLRITNNLPEDFKGGEVRTDWDETRFSDYIDNSKIDTLGNSIKSYFQALAYSLKIPQDKRIVEKSVEHTEFAFEIKQIFPDAKIIHIVRNPYSNFVSLRKFKTEPNYPFLKAIYETFQNSYYFLYKNKKMLDNYKIIKYEDLVSNPKKIMETLSDFLKIKMCNDLLKPTNNGEIWSGNSMKNMKFNGITADKLNSWKSEIFPIEIKLINNKFPFLLEDFGYRKIEAKKSFLVKNNRETWKQYLRNRIYIRQILKII